MLKRVLPYCIALTLILILFPAKVQAETLFEDTFDDGVLDNWTVVRNFSWQNLALPCYDENHPAMWQIMLQRLGIRINGAPCYTEITPTSFQIPPNQGYVFEFDMTMPESMNMDRGYTIRFVDLNHGYGVKVINNEISIGKGVAGAEPIPNSVTSYSFEANHTYHMRNELGADNTIKIYVDDHLVIDTVDIPPYHTGGTIGFQGSVGSLPTSEVWFDNVKVSTLADPRDTLLDVPYYSQRDIAWAGVPYDSAENWAGVEKTSIERWGCALTSAVMLLKYHNITDISPSVPITPLTLNAWLQNQPDGYVGKGLVNWIALMRLVKEFHRTHPSVPTLEYEYAELSQFQAQQKIDQQQPFIVELPRHFVLARGIQFSDTSLIIHDPLDKNRTTFPTAADVGISARTFTPSFTDLSYMLVVHDPSVSLDLYDPSGNIAPSHTETQADDLGGDGETSAVMHHIAKPEDGTYTLNIASTDDQQTVQLYFYNTDGEVQIETLPVTNTTYRLHYVKAGHTTIQQLSLHGEFLDTPRQVFR